MFLLHSQRHFGSTGLGTLRGVGLFDLNKDPAENRNVSEDPHYAEARQQLKAMLDAVRKQNMR